MDSTMQDFPLTITTIMRYACTVHGDRRVTTATGDGYRHLTYRELGEQAARLANALRRIGNREARELRRREFRQELFDTRRQGRHARDYRIRP